jgi:hypothetical protein
MRTKAPTEHGSATAHLADAVWQAWVNQCGDAKAASVAGLAKLSGVEPETLRVFLRPKEGASRSGPGIWMVARIAFALKLDLNNVARSALAAGDSK